MKMLSQTDKMEEFEREDNTEQESDYKKPHSFRKKLKAIMMMILFGCVAVFLVMDAATVGIEAYRTAYDSAKQMSKNETREEFYNKALAIAERTNHVSNKATIEIDKIQEMARLEVLKVSDVAYLTEKYEDKTWILKTGDVDVWLEVLASGVFTVDLQKSEFIIDNERAYVLIRVPKPELSDFRIDRGEPLLIDEQGWPTAEIGEDAVREMLNNAELSIRQGILENQETYKKAESLAIKLLQNLVKGLNLDIPNLTVEVEFMD